MAVTTIPEAGSPEQNDNSAVSNASDFFLLTGAQEYAHRVSSYASSSLSTVFPEKFRFSEVKEVGPKRTDHDGPCLVHLKGCRRSAQELIEYLHGCFLRRYVYRVFWSDYCAATLEQALAHLQELLAVAEGQESNEEVKVRIQCYPRMLEETMVDAFPDVQMSPTAFTHAMSLLQEYDTGQQKVHYSIRPRSELYFQADVRGRVENNGWKDLQYIASGSVSRAICKLEEALHVGGVELNKSMQAIDLGAAPGSWTAYLAERIKRVIAVDPTPLGENALLENVTQIRKTAESAESELQACHNEQLSDLLVCDINSHPKQTAAAALPLLQFLRPGATIIMTLKFFGRGRDKSSQVEELRGFLGEYCSSMDCVWLLANTIYERTLIARLN